VDIEILPLVMRWLHILAAITALGGVVFARLALHPTVSAELGGDAGKSFLGAVRERWKKVLHVAIFVLIISGIYNVSQTFGDRPPVYHMIFTVKFLLALVIFILAIALTGRSEATQKIRDNGLTWLTVVLVLGVTVVCLSGYLKFIPPKSADPAFPTPAFAESADE
jgi:uncharacterized membrane protein